MQYHVCSLLYITKIILLSKFVQYIMLTLNKGHTCTYRLKALDERKRLSGLKVEMTENKEMMPLVCSIHLHCPITEECLDIINIHVPAIYL